MNDDEHLLKSVFEVTLADSEPLEGSPYEVGMLLMDGRCVERRFNQGFNAQAGSIDLPHKRADSPSLDAIGTPFQEEYSRGPSAR